MALNIMSQLLYHIDKQVELEDKFTQRHWYGAGLIVYMELR